MKFQEFIQATENEQLTYFDDPNVYDTLNEIKEVVEIIIQSEPNPVQEWSQNQHKEAIQRAKQYFDMRGIEYISY